MKLKGGPKLTGDERERVKFRAGIENVFLVSGISCLIIFDMVNLNIFVWHQKIINLFDLSSSIRNLIATR